MGFLYFKLPDFEFKVATLNIATYKKWCFSKLLILSRSIGEFRLMFTSCYYIIVKFEIVLRFG